MGLREAKTHCHPSAIIFLVSNNSQDLWAKFEVELALTTAHLRTLCSWLLCIHTNWNQDILGSVVSFVQSRVLSHCWPGILFYFLVTADQEYMGSRDDQLPINHPLFMLLFTSTFKGASKHSYDWWVMKNWVLDVFFTQAISRFNCHTLYNNWLLPQ